MDELVGGVGVVRIGASPLECSLVCPHTSSEIETSPHRQGGLLGQPQCTPKETGQPSNSGRGNGTATVASVSAKLNEDGKTHHAAFGGNVIASVVDVDVDRHLCT